MGGFEVEVQSRELAEELGMSKYFLVEAVKFHQAYTGHCIAVRCLCNMMYWTAISLACPLTSGALMQVSMQLYSAREKEELNHVISVMIDYNLNYVQERTLEGNYIYNLDP